MASPNLMSAESEHILHSPPASASPSTSNRSFDASADNMPSSVVEISLNDPEQGREVLHFFVSCRGVDGNSLISTSRSAQTLVRGAYNILSSATAMNNTKSPRAKPPTEVNVEVKVARETPIFGLGPDIPVDETTLPPPITNNKGFSADIEIDNHQESRPVSLHEATLIADGLLDSESYWTERRKSRNPRFSVGLSIHCKKPTEYDRHVQILVMIPDEGTSTNKNSHVLGYASTSFQEMYTVATTRHFRQKMTLPVYSTVQEGVTVELQFADLQPQLHPLFHTQHHLLQSFLFYPLMKEEHAEMQAANAKLAIEEAAEVDFSVKIPLQLLRVCHSELVQMYHEWKMRYNYHRKKNCYFGSDAEALNFGHDVFRVQVVCGRELKTKVSAASTAASGESAIATDMDIRSSRTSGFLLSSVVGGRGGFVNRIKTAKWGNTSSSSFSSNDSDTPEIGGDTTNSVHSFVIIKYEDGMVRNREYTVGKTNTEYDSTNPVWSTNKNAAKCPHGKPSVKYQTSAVLKSRVVVSPVNALKQFVFYRPSLPDQPLAGWLRFQVFHEHYGYMSGFENELIGEVMIPLQSVRDAMKVEEKKVFNDFDGAEGDEGDEEEERHESKPYQIVTSYTLVDWFDVRSLLTDEVSGKIQLRINILLANPLVPPSDDLVTGHASELARYGPRRYRRAEDYTPLRTNGVLEDEIPLRFLYPHVLHIRKQISQVTEMIRSSEHLVEKKNTFKSSSDKRRVDVQGIPTNLHVSYFRIFRHFGSDANVARDFCALDGATAKVAAPQSFSIQERMVAPETHATVTCGAPTAHAMGLGNFGLREMELEMHTFQTVLEKITPISSGSLPCAKEDLIPEDSSDFFYTLIDDNTDAEVEDDTRSTDGSYSPDAAVSGGPTSLASATSVEPVLNRKPSKYSIMARKAAAARVKAMPNRRFVKKKSMQQLNQIYIDEKAASYAKYPSLRIDIEDVGTTMPIDDAVQLLCRLEMLRSEYYLRKSVAVSQSVSSLVTCFMAELDLCLQERNEKVLDQLAKVGFLIGWESLISSHGKELHMISDAWVAIKCLETFSLQLCEGPDMEVVVEKQKVGYIILIPIPQAYFALLPKSLLSGNVIRVTSVLFTQGINEMQSLANMVGHSGVSIQRKINSTSFRTILDYYKRFTEICGIGMSEVNVGSHPDEILRNLRLSVESENSASKNTCILLHAADAVRSLNGGRVTYCKSGKDRTAMSTTLEQARLLVQRKRHVLQEIESGSASDGGPLEEVKDVANIMREFGVRIHVAKKNVGRFKYSFNSIQRKLLPEIYRPPLSTIQGMVTSVTARDS